MGDWLRTVFEILLAAFAVIGFYSILRTIADKIFPTDSLPVAVAVKISEGFEVENLELLLDAASCTHKGRAKNGELVVLISQSLMNGVMGYGEVLRPEHEAVLRRYNADCYVVAMRSEDDVL